MAGSRDAALSGFADVNGTRLFYEIAGAGSTLTLIHGFGLDMRMWDDQWAALTRRRRVLRYDARGFGKSAVPSAERYSHAEDLRALLQYLEIEHTALIGFSLGGGIAISFALDYPAAVDALIVAGCLLPGWRLSAELGVSFSAIWSAGRTLGVAAARARWLQHPLFAPILKQPRARARLSQIVADYSGWEWAHKDPQFLSVPPAAERLAEIHAPTLAIVGERDLADFHAIAGLIERDVPGARRVVVSGAGHVVNMEASERFNALVIEFLAEKLRIEN